jgi:hypothetical protein
MSATRQFNETGTPLRRLAGRSGWRIVGQADIAHRVGESQQIIGSRFRWALDREPDHFPTARSREGLRMLLAQVVAVRFGLARQGTENRCRVSIRVRQGRGGRTLAACS